MLEHGLANHTHFALLDANVVAGYYLPDSLSSKQARTRIKNIINGVKQGGASEVLLYIPNFCITEVFAVFSKYAFATWDRQVKKNLKKTLTKEDFNSLIDEFKCDFENGSIINSVELNMYHILATNLINRVDANYQYYRNRKNVKVKRQKRMMGAADHTIIGMGIYLSKIHGRDNFVILTADNRLSDILTRAKSVRSNTAKKLGLQTIAQNLGLPYSKSIYPKVINLAKAPNRELKEFFGVWPLNETPLGSKKLTKLSRDDCEILANLRRKSGIGRDSLPYTPQFEYICREFEKIKGQQVDRNEAWKGIGRVEKKGKNTSEN